MAIDIVPRTKTSEKRATAVASSIPATELLSSMNVPSLNHASNARKNQHKREIATALHVLVGGPFRELESVVPSDGVSTSGHTLEKPEKGATLSHFFSGARRLSGPRSWSASRSSVMTCEMEGPFSASQKASRRPCAAKRPAISARVHYLQVSLSRATPTCPFLDLFHVRGRNPLERARSARHDDRARQPAKERTGSGNRNSMKVAPRLYETKPSERGRRTHISDMVQQARRSGYIFGGRQAHHCLPIEIRGGGEKPLGDGS
jgi:hypothetical protein